MAAGFTDGELRVWRIANESPLHLGNDICNPVRLNGSHVITESTDPDFRKLVECEVEEEDVKIVGSVKLPDNVSSAVLTTTFLENSPYCIFDDEHKWFVWNWRDRKMILEGRLAFSDETGIEQVQRAGVSSDHRTIAVQLDNCYFVSTNDGTVKYEIRGNFPFAFHPNKPLVAIIDEDEGQVEIRNTTSFALVGKKENPLEGSAFDVLFRFVPDTNDLILIGENGVICWNYLNESPEPLKVLRLHEGAIRDAALSIDGKLLVTGGDDRVARIWNTNAFKFESVLQIGPDLIFDRQIENLSISDKGVILFAEAGGTLSFWDSKTFCQIGPKFRVGRNGGDDLVFLENDRFLVGGEFFVGSKGPLGSNTEQIKSELIKNTGIELDKTMIPRFIDPSVHRKLR